MFTSLNIEEVGISLQKPYPKKSSYKNNMHTNLCVLGGQEC